jgi:hypothetical protein
VKAETVRTAVCRINGLSQVQILLPRRRLHHRAGRAKRQSMTARIVASAQRGRGAL